ncbi:hypothetical protein, partial [Stutzerimonas nitrititolerans]|uniref:hypothetical protein n=1 Tax=Stutzerimonas nitrititolerans TaxID=2482751 RepID=UPI0028A1B70E
MEVEVAASRKWLRRSYFDAKKDLGSGQQAKRKGSLSFGLTKAETKKATPESGLFESGCGSR